MSKNSFSYVGKKIPKIDALDKVTGTASYGHDIKLPGMLYCKIKRSSYPHAKILNIDTSKAEKLPGVRAVITGRDVKSMNIGFMQDHPILKTDKVRSYRDEIAAVAAISEDIAEEAINLIDVDYEPLPGVFDPIKAMEPDAPLIHEKAKGNLLKFKYKFQVGDIEKAFSESPHIVEGEYQTQFVTHCCLEPCFALASFDPKGNLTFYSTTQIPYLMQNHFSSVLGIPGEKIRIIQPVIGGAFGSKLDTYPYEYITIILAQKTSKPVRITFTREEEFQCSPTRQPSIITMKTACDENGKLTARKFSAILDNGAYTSWGATTPHIMLIGISSLYKVPNIFFEAQSVYTNNPYSGAFRGYGNPQATFANEQQMDELAEKIGIDPIEFRLINANEPNSITPQGFKITTCDLEKCITTAAKRIDFHKNKEPFEGVGIASMMHVGGGGRVYRSDGCGVIAKLDDFGRLTLITGASEIGSGSDTGIAIIAAETLGIPVDSITVINNDTDICPWDVGIHASRTTFIAGNATLKACNEIKDKLREIASKVLECDVNELIFKNGNISSKLEPSKSIAMGKVLRKVHFKSGGEVLTASAFYDPPNEMQSPEMIGNVSATYTFGTHAVRVKIDPETGKIKIKKFVAVHEVGRIINRLGLEGQVEGAIAQGLGFALSENVHLKEGKMINTSFLDYKLFMAKDIPEDVELHFIEVPDPEGPYGAKGIGEAGLIPTAAAVANAVKDALGIRFKELPITPEKVLTALKNKA
ncbi:xanthine dehydrogenase family protein molybdopterin-binding subunit [bacterium]|nr:xanthine dehydrogenase family protein molybdopterin-binding subunit [bacterium]